MKTISFANFAGGVAKSISTALVSYELAKMGYKCLDIDFDAQQSLTRILLKNKHLNTKNRDSFTVACSKNIPLSKLIINVKTNLDLIPNDNDFIYFGRWLDQQSVNEGQKIGYLANKIAPLSKNYDFCFIDTEPTPSLQNDTALYACDWLVVPLMTQPKALVGCHNLAVHVQNDLIKPYQAPVDILGLVPVLMEKGAKVDKEVLSDAKQKYGSLVFKSNIPFMERIKRFSLTGITDNHYWDKVCFKKIKSVAEEILSRLQKEDN